MTGELRIMATTKMIQSVERAFAIIEYLESTSGDQKSIKEIADRIKGVSAQADNLKEIVAFFK